MEGDQLGVARQKTAFGDLRGWIAALEQAGELNRIGAKVDWNVELGTIIRLASGTGQGPAMLFENIKDYDGPDARCNKLFAGGLSSLSRHAMMFGLPPDASPTDMVRLCRTVLAERVAPVTVPTGPVKENILTGDQVNLLDFPVPLWNRKDGGRYIATFAGVVTKDPETGIHNVGIYRGMVADPRTIPMLLWRAQHWGVHFTKYEQMGKPMPVAIVMGWEPSFGFTAGAPVPQNVCEYDVMGAIRGAPVELVECETSDLLVPASAEIVIEGEMSTNPDDFVFEGPYAEFTGFYGGDAGHKPTVRVSCITHRNDPILRGTLEGAIPGSYSENAVMSAIQRSATAWNVLETAGVPGVTNVWCPPVHAGINVIVQIQQFYRGQAKQVAAALWGSSAAHVRYKHVWVVDDDIDIHDYGAVDWAFAYRVNAGEDDIVIYPNNFGAGLDPSTRKAERNPLVYGTGKWNRVLIDATINLDFEPEPDFGGERYPPSVKPAEDDVAAVTARWDELGFKDKPRW